MKTHYRCTFTIPPDSSEMVMAYLYMLDMHGCEESAETQSSAIIITAYFTTETVACQASQTITATFPQVTASDVEAVPNQDWNAEWRKTMQPAVLAPFWWVSPQWLPPPGKDGDRWIKIEPKMAFGTGHHETTRLAAQALITAQDKVCGNRLLDIGTGSGVLCFTGALLGAAWCLGVELDGDCRENLAENRMLNIDANDSSFVIGTLDAIATPIQHFDVIVMNMIHTESAPQLSRCKTMLKHDGILVWSGILNDEHMAACDAAALEGFSLCNATSEHEWWCGVFGIM